MLIKNAWRLLLQFEFACIKHAVMEQKNIFVRKQK